MTSPLTRRPSPVRAEGQPSRRLEWASGAMLAVFAGTLVAVRTNWAPARSVDDSILDAAHDVAVANAWLVDTARALSVLGMLPVRLVLIGAAAVVLWRHTLHRAAVFVVAVELSGLLLNNLIKLGVDRLRPTFDVQIESAPGSSFPSGHAMDSMICYSLLASAVLFSGLVRDPWRRPVAAALFAVPFLVGASRVVLGVHYPSDVLAGWTLGLAWVGLATALVRPWRRASR